jgi:putative peptidoglycan lipid II flippase
VKRQTILAGAGIMAAAAFLSRILGWVRDRQIGHYWGSGPHTEAYWAAFMVPDLLYYILAGGALGASIIPVFTAYLREGKEEESYGSRTRSSRCRITGARRDGSSSSSLRAW